MQQHSQIRTQKGKDFRSYSARGRTDIFFFFLSFGNIPGFTATKRHKKKKKPVAYAEEFHYGI